MQTQNLTDILNHFPSLPAPLLADHPCESAQTFILYSDNLNLTKLQAFQQKCGENFLCFAAWNLLHNTVVLLKGEWKAEWIGIAHELTLDIASLNFHASLKQAGLLVMDMDSTAIQIECIDEIAKLAGTGDMVSAITERAMRGELDFSQSLRQRVATLKDAPEGILQEVKQHLPLMPGLVETVKELKNHGWKVAIASGGFTYFAEVLQQKLGLDFIAANQFEIIDGKLTGNVQGTIVDAQYKAQTLQQLAQQFNIATENTVAIGDGANDLAMMQVADVGVAYHAKPKVQQLAQVIVNFTDLTALLCILSANDKIK
ncbi:phosphoserine phosphatase [Aggregatibacter aphrophilus]|uniref:phosphoserine phosphatase n=1 Tax=Aggregatibacter aphrophilus TaxID=732 RepID=UPI000DA33545|nr:phosphoserine phosphatase [Aggregatibacter aphrophilus]RDE92076.1 phosphoserine phosphatase [Aggregatibacter aphrophilus]SQI92212.1 Phosphoserine phosphatase [Aggregatibacter aphrophilus]